MLIVACMNGAFGFRWMKRAKKRDYMSDVVHECLIYDNDAGFEAYVNDQTVEFSVRGSLMYKRQMERFILKYNSPDNTLLMIGKSKGGYWMNEIAKWFENEHDYKDWVIGYAQKRLILVDPCWLGRNGKNITPPTTFDMVYNFYQTNERFLNGAWIASRESLDILKTPIIQHDLTRPGVDHWTIIHASEVKQAIRKSMEVLI